MWRLQVTDIMCDNLSPGHCCCGFLLWPLPPSQGGQAASLQALLLTEQLLQAGRTPRNLPPLLPPPQRSRVLEGAGRTAQPVSPFTGNRWFRMGCQRAACGLKAVAYDWGPLSKTQHLLHQGSSESPTLIHTGTMALLMVVIRQVFNE